jgi:hypothetical protein
MTEDTAGPSRIQSHQSGWTELANATGRCVRCTAGIPRGEVRLGGYCATCAASIDAEDSGNGWDCSCGQANFPDDECMACGKPRPPVDPAELMGETTEAIRAEGIQATCNDDALIAALDLSRFDYVTARRDSGSLVVLTYDGDSEWLVCEYADRAAFIAGEARDVRVCAPETAEPVAVFVSVYYRDAWRVTVGGDLIGSWDNPHDALDKASSLSIWVTADETRRPGGVKVFEGEALRHEFNTQRTALKAYEVAIGRRPA